MIHGIGTDLIQVGRIAAALQRSGERFAEKILGADELDEFHRRRAQNPARGLRYLATRFAAKEAFSKAIGLGLRLPMRWRSMQTLNAASGQPCILTSGELANYLEQHGLMAHISITDEVDYAVAFVIVEKK